MTSDLLATLIIKFCSVKTKEDLYNDPQKTACVFFLLNCSVNKNGEIKESQFEDCKGMYIKNKDKITKEYGG